MEDTKEEPLIKIDISYNMNIILPLSKAIDMLVAFSHAETIDDSSRTKPKIVEGVSGISFELLPKDTYKEYKVNTLMDKE